MDYRFEQMQRHLEGCLLQSSVFERTIEGAQLFDVDMVDKAGVKWLVIAAGISDVEARSYIQSHHRERATVPMQLTPQGQASILLIIRPWPPSTPYDDTKYITYFSVDVGVIELYQGSYVRIDNIESPAIRQIRWELDAVAGHRPAIEPWLRGWECVVRCNPAHAPSHWHINSPPIVQLGRRDQHRTIVPPELRIATGLPNPLLLLLSIANWLRSLSTL